MPKKKSVARRDEADAAKFDDTPFEAEKILYTATYDYNELTFSHAASHLIERGRNIALGIAVTLLVAIVSLMLINQDLVIYAVVLVFFAVAAINANNRWPKWQLRYAGKTTLAVAGDGERRHVVVTQKAVHLRGTLCADEDYDLGELRSVSSDSTCLVAGFGNRRYVYVPADAMSVDRFRELVRFLGEHKAGK